MCRIGFLWFVLLSTSRQVISSRSETDNNTCAFEKNESSDEHACSLYLAPSSISGAGFGIFTTKGYLKGEDILPYSEATSIVICDTDMDAYDWSHNDYTWGGAGLASFECISPSESVMTFGALCNYHTAFVNIKGYAEDYDDTVVNRFADAGAGAFSYYKGHQFKATTHIAAGEELFAEYGNTWLESREGTFADAIPRKNDFNDAATIMGIVRDKMSTPGFELNDPLFSSIKDVAGIFNKRVASFLPGTKSAFEALLEKNSSFFSNIAETTLEKRDVTWIRENGLCIDNISPGKSTLPQAGQGAFATRFMPLGDIISPAPLLQIMNSDHMLIHDEELTDESYIGTQMLVNYCFGHSKSKLLLCPQTNVILINHCSNRKVGDGQCGDKGPNAKVRWASGWDCDTPSWLEMSLEEVGNFTAERSRGLSMEFIAIRDIKAGEEIFIDYGPHWEAAWDLHKKTWTPPTEDSPFRNYTPIKEMAGVKFRTVDELEENPYPGNVVTGCFWYEWKEEGYDPDEEGYYNAADYINQDYGGVHGANDVWMCELLEELNDDYFDVRIPVQRNLIEEVLLTQFPKESIIFRTKPYLSDQHLPGAFRHFIEIEESLFPNQWKHSE